MSEEEVYVCIRCAKTDDQDGIGFQFFHRGCVTADELVIADADDDALPGDPDDICFRCFRKADSLRGGLRFLPVHDGCLTEKELDAIMDDEDAFVEAWDKAFPGDTYETAPEGEFNIRQAHAQEMYERTFPKPADHG